MAAWATGTALVAAGAVAVPADAADDDPYAEAVLATSPDLYWQFNDEPGATTVADSSGHDAVGLVEGVVTFGDRGIGLHGTSARLENLQGTITAARNASDGQDLTLAFWYRSDDRATTLASLGTKGMWLYPANDIGGDLNFKGLNAIDRGEDSWQFITYTEKDGIGTLYQNAWAEPAQPEHGPPGTGPVEPSPAAPWVFGSAWDWFEHTPVWIDEVATYSRALSAEEIATLYAIGNIGNEPARRECTEVGPLGAGQQVTAETSQVPVEYGTVSTRFRLGSKPSGNGDYLSLSTRVTGAGAYRAKTIVRPDGSTVIQLIKVAGTEEQVLGSTNLKAPIADPLPGTAVDVRLGLAPDAAGVQLTGTWTVNGTTESLTAVDEAAALPSGVSEATVYRSSAAVGDSGIYGVCSLHSLKPGQAEYRGQLVAFPGTEPWSTVVNGGPPTLLDNSGDIAQIAISGRPVGWSRPSEWAPQGGLDATLNYSVSAIGPGGPAYVSQGFWRDWGTIEGSGGYAVQAVVHPDGSTELKVLDQNRDGAVVSSVGGNLGADPAGLELRFRVQAFVDDRGTPTVRATLDKATDAVEEGWDLTAALPGARPNGRYAIGTYQSSRSTAQDAVVSLHDLTILPLAP